MAFNFVEFLILVSVVYLLITVIKLDGRVKGMKYTLDQISKLTDVPEMPINNEL